MTTSWQPSLTSGTAPESSLLPPPGSTWAGSSGHLQDLGNKVTKCSSDFIFYQWHRLLLAQTCQQTYWLCRIHQRLHQPPRAWTCARLRDLSPGNTNNITVTCLIQWLTNEIFRICWDWSWHVLPLLSRSKTLEFTDAMILLKASENRWFHDFLFKTSECHSCH